jgi:dopamine beta-monooxygenase
MSQLCFLTVLVLLVLVTSHSHTEVLRRNIHAKYRNSFKFDENYTLLWSLSNKNKTVNFAIDCKSTGWVGFGFSLHGKMAPSSDFFIAYIDTKGKVHFSDRYSLKREEPKTDEELGGTNDFKLLTAKEENGRYIIEFSRDAITKDRFDVPIKLEGNTNVIWAYSNRKPVNIGDPLSYHSRFGSTEITFGIPSPQRPLPDKDVVKTPIQMDNFKLSNEHTQYICKNFKYSELGLKEESHAVKFEPIIDNARMLHHMIIYECSFNVNTTDPEFSCLNDMPRCEMTYLWAVGGKDFYTPDKVGIRVGGPKYDNIILQIHYDNPENLENHIDSSGVMMYSTKHFRTHDSGVMTLGVPMRLISIPPRNNAFPVQDACENSCSTEKIFIYSYAFHMHMIGSEIESRIIRNGKEIEKFEEKEWDFDRQDSGKFISISTKVRLQKEIPIFKGDIFTTKCTYNSLERTNVTRGGYPSVDEMCYNFVAYYPKKHGPAFCHGRFCRVPRN